jgi:hypothetical protein
MLKKRRFPKQLLKQTADVRLQYFLDLTVVHPRLQTARQNLMRAIWRPFSGALVFVSGPAGVGKTTLFRKISRELIEAVLPGLEVDRGRIPVVAVEGPSSESGVFNWKDFYKRLLCAVDEPLVAHKINPDTGAKGLSSQRTRQPAVTAELRLAIEQTLRHRRTSHLLIDEAQHLSRIASGRRLQDQLDTLKSLSNMSDTLIVLFGSYELHHFRNLSGQLSRRSIDVHFPRYDSRLAADVDAFRNLLFTFQGELPLQEEPDFDERWQYFYERSVGCVGVLKDWLSRAYEDALREGGKRLTAKQIEMNELSTSQLDKMLDEAFEGEQNLKDTEEKRRKLRARFGFEVGTAESDSDGVRLEVQSCAELSAKAKAVRRNAAVGKRKPVRDPVGKKTVPPDQSRVIRASDSLTRTCLR